MLARNKCLKPYVEKSKPISTGADIEAGLRPFNSNLIMWIFFPPYAVIVQDFCVSLMLAQRAGPTAKTSMPAGPRGRGSNCPAISVSLTFPNGISSDGLAASIPPLYQIRSVK